MIGVLDSGAGGELAAREIRRLMPTADVAVLADRKNAPYGTKSRERLTELVEDGVMRLRDAGADEILIACCTASTVYERLRATERRNIYPIIEPTASAAVRASRTGSFGVIATEATVRSHAFARAIREKYGADASVFELAAQRLVSIIESGVRDGCATAVDKKRIKEILTPILSMDIDVLVLGCTHFPLLSEVIGEIIPWVRLISSTHEGVKEIMRHATPRGSGATVYL